MYGKASLQEWKLNLYKERTLLWNKVLRLGPSTEKGPVQMRASDNGSLRVEEPSFVFLTKEYPL